MESSPSSSISPTHDGPDLSSSDHEDDCQPGSIAAKVMEDFKNIGSNAAKVLEELRQEVEAFKPEDVKPKIIPIKRTIADVEAEVKQARLEGEMIKAQRKREYYTNLSRIKRRGE